MLPTSYGSKADQQDHPNAGLIACDQNHIYRQLFQDKSITQCTTRKVSISDENHYNKR